MTRILAALCLCFSLLTAVTPALAFDGVDIATVRRKAEAGDADAQSKLGVLYSQGMGVKKDKEEAARWYRRSADQGDPVGQWNLAFLYVKGEGVPLDYPKARELFRQSAERGFSNAEYDLGMMLLQGLGGEQDQKEAKKWFQTAADQGYREAVDILKELDAKDAIDVKKEELLQ